MRVKQGKADTRHKAIQRVLIVEDEPSAREASQRYLDRCGYRVETAADAQEALARAEEMTPDLTVCDWRLGGAEDGVDVARELQRRYGTAIIFVTAHPLDELREATRDLSVAAYMPKPVSLNALAETIATIGPQAN